MDIKDLRSGKVKLVFGDPLQIKVLRSHEKDLEEAEKIKTYEVTISFAGTFCTKVEARNEEEAEEFARDELDVSASEIDDVSVERIEEVSRKGSDDET